MKRIVSCTLISAAFVLAPACKKEDAKTDDAAAAKDGEAKDGEAKEGEAAEDKAEAPAEAKKAEAAPASSGADAMDALKMVPDEAMVAGTMDLGLLQKIPTFNEALVASMIDDPEAKKTFETFRGCGLELNMLRRISFGAASGSQQGMGIVDGDGIAERAKLDCLAKKAKEENGTEITFTDGDGYTVALSDKGDMVLFAVGNDRLVMTDPKWREAVEARVKGEGKSAVEGSLAEVLPLADTSKKIWFVLRADEDMKRDLQGQPLAGMSGAGVWFDGLLDPGATKRFDMGVKIGMPDEGQATSGKGFLEAQYQQVKPMAGMMGLPPTLPDKVKFGAEGSNVTISVSLDAADLDALEKALKQMQQAQMGGAPGGMPGGAPGGMPGGAPGGAPGGMPGGM